MSGIFGESGVTGGPQVNYSDPAAVTEMFAQQYMRKNLAENVGPQMLGYIEVHFTVLIPF
jgi:hypothetical protein